MKNKQLLNAEGICVKGNIDGISTSFLSRQADNSGFLYKFAPQNNYSTVLSICQKFQ